MCMSIGQRGSAEKSFDYILPSNKWVHIAITCSLGGNGSGSGSGSGSTSASVVSLYADGEFKDSQNIRCNLPIGTFGINKKNQSFYGKLCEMRIWSCARTASEIKRDLYTDVSGTCVQIFFHEIF